MSGKSAGGVETEVKLLVQDPTSAVKLLTENGFVVSHEREFEANSIYDTPEGSIRARGELLRLRRSGDRSILTWKGQATPGVHKARPETEVEVSDYDLCDRILQNLGHQITFRYEKYRTEFREQGGEGVATLDETPIGVYMELEGPAEWIDQTAERLGFKPSDYITASYGTLYLNYCAERSIEPCFMQFADSDSKPRS